jgi:hypothetical protein
MGQNLIIIFLFFYGFNAHFENHLDDKYFYFFSGQLSKSCENQDFFKRLMTIL